MISSGSLFAGLGQRVAEDQPAFRVGIVDLDLQSLAAVEARRRGGKAAAETLFSTAGISR